jgi:hypothetical protein
VRAARREQPLGVEQCAQARQQRVESFQQRPQLGRGAVQGQRAQVGRVARMHRFAGALHAAQPGAQPPVQGSARKRQQRQQRQHHPDASAGQQLATVRRVFRHQHAAATVVAGQGHHVPGRLVAQALDARRQQRRRRCTVRAQAQPPAGVEYLVDHVLVVRPDLGRQRLPVVVAQRCLGQHQQALGSLHQRAVEHLGGLVAHADPGDRGPGQPQQHEHAPQPAAQARLQAPGRRRPVSARDGSRGHDAC